MLKIKLEIKHGIFIVRLSGYLDKDTYLKFSNYLLPMVLKQGIKYMLYDLNDLISIDTQGLNALLNGKKAIENNNGFLCICDIPEKMEKYFDKINVLKTSDEFTALKLMSF